MRELLDSQSDCILDLRVFTRTRENDRGKMICICRKKTSQKASASLIDSAVALCAPSWPGDFGSLGCRPGAGRADVWSTVNRLLPWGLPESCFSRGTYLTLRRFNRNGGVMNAVLPSFRESVTTRTRLRRETPKFSWRKQRYVRATAVTLLVFV